MPEFLKFTSKGESFVFYDSGTEERFFISSTISNLKLLEKAHLFCDGTFDIAPKLFGQVYTIQALIEGRCVPLVYGLLPRKTEAMYTEFLTQVKSKLSHDPLSITSDYEKAFLNAANSVFRETKLYGCYFHLKQSFWKKIIDLGLKSSSTEDENIRRLLKLPQAIAFIPSNDVVEVFSQIKSSITDTRVIEFYNYIEDNYIGKFVQCKVGRGRGVKTISSYSRPLFDVNLWNVNERTSECLPRTNNFVESWHNAFSSMLDKHPLVYSLIDYFLKEQKRVEHQLV
ncbi:unnamed protein product [Brachionus calyciflorus]|uniref:MULE transposase domain-containing protein n=1 Tax=Brachionus calyciflorus TaxID=104777 RepID=A0A814R4R7_9BILA|nr:unnamed protein product [Brachionus calyciflorus]